MVAISRKVDEVSAHRRGLTSLVPLSWILGVSCMFS